ncbi:hypothetical protein [Nocardia sp. CA-119907]|uniref:hypothetical protein n=1 Tax=Nocardia sp. CA-119907 TaxID=3239973 RepID=UPI003D95AE9E
MRSALAAVLIVVGAVVGTWGLNHTSAAHTSRPPNPGVALDGKYEAIRTPRTFDGKPVESATPYTRVWSVRSYCPPHSERCVASITTQDPSTGEKAAMVADYRDGARISTRELPPAANCTSTVNKAPIESRAWERVVVRFAAGSWTGTVSPYGTESCTHVWEFAMTLRRVGEIDPAVTVVAPDTIPARVDTMPIAPIRGTYELTLPYLPTPDFPNPPPQEKVRQPYDTICTRNGDRCVATTSPAPGASNFPPFMLEGGAWRSVYTEPYTCHTESDEPVTNATFHWELFRSDAGPDLIKSLTGTWVLDKADPCHATSRGSVDMQRVGDRPATPDHRPGSGELTVVKYWIAAATITGAVTKS